MSTASKVLDEWRQSSSSMSIAEKALAHWKQNQPQYVSSEHIVVLSYLRSLVNDIPFNREVMRHFNKNKKSAQVSAAKFLKAINDYNSGFHFTAISGEYSRLCKKYVNLMKDFGLNFDDISRDFEEGIKFQCVRLIYKN